MNAIKLNTRKPHTENSLGSLFDSFFKPDFFGGIDPYHRSPFKKPPVNIIESDNSFKLDFSVPGWKKEDIKIEIDDKILIVSGEARTEKVEETDKLKRREFKSETFKRSFVLPEEVDDAKIDGKYEDGILSITLPKTEKAIKTKKQIEIS